MCVNCIDFVLCCVVVFLETAGCVRGTMHVQQAARVVVTPG